MWKEAGGESLESDLESSRHQVYLGLGSSLGDRMAHLGAALRRLHCPEGQTRLRQISSIYETPHMGLKAGDETRYPPHLNCVALIETTLSPLALLSRVQEIEAEGGRQREQRWGPRTIDIDLLLYLEVHKKVYNNVCQEDCHNNYCDELAPGQGYRNVSIETCELILPHPRLASRIFVVVPLLEIAPNITFADNQPVRDLLETDSLRAQPIKRVYSDELLI